MVGTKGWIECCAVSDLYFFLVCICLPVWRQVGVRLVANALVCGRTAPHLRVVVMCNTKKPRYTELRAGMALGDASQTVDAWIEYQSNMQASSVRPNGATLVS